MGAVRINRGFKRLVQLLSRLNKHMFCVIWKIDSYDESIQQFRKVTNYVRDTVNLQSCWTVLVFDAVRLKTLMPSTQSWCEKPWCRQANPEHHQCKKTLVRPGTHQQSTSSLSQSIKWVCFNSKCQYTTSSWSQLLIKLW